MKTKSLWRRWQHANVSKRLLSLGIVSLAMSTSVVLADDIDWQELSEGVMVVELPPSSTTIAQVLPSVGKQTPSGATFVPHSATANQGTKKDGSQGQGVFKGGDQVLGVWKEGDKNVSGVWSVVPPQKNIYSFSRAPQSAPVTYLWSAQANGQQLQLLQSTAQNPPQYAVVLEDKKADGKKADGEKAGGKKADDGKAKADVVAMSDLTAIALESQTNASSPSQMSGFFVADKKYFVSLMPTGVADQASKAKVAGQDVAIVLSDPSSGIVLFDGDKIDVDSDLSLDLSSDDPQWGQSVKSIYTWSGVPAIVSGVVSTKPVMADGYEYAETDLVVGDSAIGAPVIADDGKVLGIVRSVRKFGSAGRGTAVMIPNAHVERLLVLAEEGVTGIYERPFLGVSMMQVDDEVKVARVIEGSAAKEAGVEAGWIIKKLDGEALESNEDLIRVIAGKKVGDEVEMIYRKPDSEDEEEMTVTLGERPAMALVSNANQLLEVQSPMYASMLGRLPATGMQALPKAGKGVFVPSDQKAVIQALQWMGNQQKKSEESSKEASKSIEQSQKNYLNAMKNFGETQKKLEGELKRLEKLRQEQAKLIEMLKKQMSAADPNSK